MNVQFQHTAARRRLVSNGLMAKGTALGFNTQPPEGGWGDGCSRLQVLNQVSTHSRPKAAGCLLLLVQRRICGFNTQPPEGGWLACGCISGCPHEFQHTAARRRLGLILANWPICWIVSTHSRPKAAGAWAAGNFGLIWVSTHSRPKAAGWW